MCCIVVHLLVHRITTFAHANVRGPWSDSQCAHSPRPHDGNIMCPCPIWPHAIQRTATPSDPRDGTEIPSMHVITASSLGPRYEERAERRRARSKPALPAPHPPPPPYSPARHSPRQPYEPPVGEIHLHLQSPTSAPVTALITAPNIMPRGASCPHALMPSCPPSSTVLPRRSLREAAGAASK